MCVYTTSIVKGHLEMNRRIPHQQLFFFDLGDVGVCTRAFGNRGKNKKYVKN